MGLLRDSHQRAQLLNVAAGAEHFDGEVEEDSEFGGEAAVGGVEQVHGARGGFKAGQQAHEAAISQGIAERAVNASG